MADATYTRPELPPSARPHNLTPAHGKGNALTPETSVVFINRGVDPIRDKFDGIDYIIPPGLNDGPYGAVAHFKARAVVPGSRNPENGRQESFIGILGIDRPEKCQPFTPEQCKAFGLRVEAIAREELMLPSARAARPVDRGEVEARLLAGQGRHVPLPPMADMQATGAAAEETAAILAPPETTDAQEEAREYAAEHRQAAASEEEPDEPRVSRRGRR